MITIIIFYSLAILVFLGTGLFTGLGLRKRNISQKQALFGKTPGWRYAFYAAVAVSIVLFQDFLRTDIFSRLPAGLLLFLIPFVYAGFSCLICFAGGLNFTLFFHSDKQKALRGSVLLFTLGALIFFLFTHKYAFPLRQIGHHVGRNGITYQTTGFSCGPASMSTLLRLWGMELTERELGEKMFTGLGGTNLAANRHLLGKIGFTGREIPCDMAQAAAYNLPFIASIDFSGINHQVIAAGVTPGGVILLDPNLGLEIKTRREFEDCWLAAMTVVPSEFADQPIEPKPVPGLSWAAPASSPVPTLDPLWSDLEGYRISPYIRTEEEFLNIAHIIEVSGSTAAPVLLRYLSSRGVAAGVSVDTTREVTVSRSDSRKPVRVTFGYPVPRRDVWFPRMICITDSPDITDDDTVVLSCNTEAGGKQAIINGLTARFPFLQPDELDLAELETYLKNPAPSGLVSIPHTIFGLPVYDDTGGREAITLCFQGETVEVTSMKWTRISYYQSGNKVVSFPHEAAERAVKSVEETYPRLPDGISIESLVFMRQGALLWPVLKTYIGGTPNEKSRPLFINFLTGRTTPAN